MPTYTVKLMRRKPPVDEIDMQKEHVQDEDLLYRMRQFFMEPHFDTRYSYLIVEVEQEEVQP